MKPIRLNLIFFPQAEANVSAKKLRILSQIQEILIRERNDRLKFLEEAIRRSKESN